MRIPSLICIALLGLSGSGVGDAAPGKGTGQKPAARGAATAKAKPAPAQTLDLGSLTARVPAGWKTQERSSEFRVAEYRVPPAKGDTDPTSFIVFYFGKAGGGSVEANIERWLGMMRQPNGGDAKAAARRGQVERPGLRVTTLDVPGTYLERPFPASPRVTERHNYRMLAAIIEPTKENNEGPHYFRIVGPARTVEAARPGWQALLASLRAK